MTNLPRPIFMLVTDRQLAGGEDALVEAVTAAVDSGVNMVQLREKDLDRRKLAQLAARLHDAIAGQALLIINGDTEVAAEGDGLQLPEDAPFARPEGAGIVGRSVHSVDKAVQAEVEGIDYVIAGPIFPTASHPGRAAAGVGLISDISSAVSVPVIAIGGITADRVPEVMSAGASGIAVVSAILSAESPGRAAAMLRHALDVIAVGER